MVFKLIRIDAQSPSKIQLSTGVHVIGRGKFLHNDDTDKRVSRNHAELEVTNDIVNLKALHQNPCFFIKNNTDETELLQQDCTISLCHGDRFGLIPDHFWYEVLHCHQDNEDIPEDREGGTNGLHAEGVKDVVEQNSKNSSDSARDSKEMIHFENHEEDEDAVQNRSCSPSIMNNDQESTDEYESKPQLPLDADKRTPNKRSNSSPETSPIDVKKVKTEPDDGVASGAAVAGPSNGQASSDSDGKTKDDTSPAKTNNVPSRERCIYGANCYRLNNNKKERQKRYREKNREKLKQREAERRKRIQHTQSVAVPSTSPNINTLEVNNEEKSIAGPSTSLNTNLLEVNNEEIIQTAVKIKRECQRRYRERNRDKLKQREAERRRRLKNAEISTSPNIESTEIINEPIITIDKISTDSQSVASLGEMQNVVNEVSQQNGRSLSSANVTEILNNYSPFRFHKSAHTYFMDNLKNNEFGYAYSISDRLFNKM